MSVCCSLLPWVGIPIGLLYLLYYLNSIRKRQDVKGKVVLITGAASGLGRACAHEFYKAGCKLILVMRRKEQGDDVIKELLDSKPSCETHEPKGIVLDLCHTDMVYLKIREALSFHQRIDIVINNAGVACRGEVLKSDLDVFRKVMEVNYFGQVAITKAILPGMISQGGGTVVNISSLQGRFSIPYRSAYGASKHALQAFADCLRAEVSSKNIHICVVSPGYIKTNLSVNALCADGSRSGVTSPEISTGMSPESAAQRILLAVERKESDVLIGPCVHRLAVYLRCLMPNIYFKVMSHRAKAECKDTSEEKESNEDDKNKTE